MDEAALKCISHQNEADVNVVRHVLNYFLGIYTIPDYN